MKTKLLKIAALAALLLAAMIPGQAQNVPITLNQGWNWISYPRSEPMGISEALSGFTPAVGDILSSQTDGSAQYLNGRWRGTLTTLVPGKGYMYKSVDGTTKSFVFGGVANDPSTLPEEALSGEFKVNANGTKVRFSPGNLQCRVDPSKESQIIVGTGTSTTNFMPYYTFYNYSLCQMIYKAEELRDAGLTAGPITGIAFQSSSNYHYLRNGIEIWMSATTLTEAPTTSVTTSYGMKKVYYGSVTQQTGWTEIAFTSSPFEWDGTSNLMVTVLMNHGSYNSSTPWQCSILDYTCCSYARRDSSPYSPKTETYSMTTSTSRPNTRFSGKGGVTWRFAEKQWDVIGENNRNISGSYTGWIDLFGWGTSGHPHGANCWQPWSTSNDDGDYYAYGSMNYNLFDQTRKADWGCNPISNGGNQPDQWRTLTKEEWNYMLNTRTGKRYAKATVDGVKGLIVLPDGWQTSYYSLSNTNTATAAFTSNTITATQWSTLEQHGAVFLPAGGYRNGTVLGGVGQTCYYWSSSCGGNGSGITYSVYIENAGITIPYEDNSHYGNSVRLVCQSNPHVRTLGVTGVTSTSATATGVLEYTGSGTILDGGICYNTTGAPTFADNYNVVWIGPTTFNIPLTDLTPNTTYYVRACVNIGGTYNYGNELTFTTPDDGSNGHAYVDLGLPSGTLWATCNLGATTPEGYGNYYAWGETTTKDSYTWSTYRYSNDSNGVLTKYCSNSEYGYNGFVDNLTILLPEDDVVKAAWGGDWRMPTVEEWQELRDNTTHVWTTQNGVNGRLFTAANGNSIFLPAAGERYGTTLDYVGSSGRYWSNSCNASSPKFALGILFSSDNFSLSGPFRYEGRSVRAVCSGQN